MAGHGLSAQPFADAAVEAYLSDLAGRLRGPRRRREQILAELRDGLDHAVTDHATAGLPDQRAVTATLTLAAVALIADITVIAAYLRSDIPGQPLAVLAVAASLTRMTCGLVTIRHTTAMRHAMSVSSPAH